MVVLAAERLTEMLNEAGYQMMILGEERERLIGGLGGGAAFVRLANGEEVHPALTPWCRRLAFSLEREDFAPAGLNLVPLWEGENSITGFFVRDGVTTFVRYDVEYIEAYEVLGHDVRAVLTDAMRWVEDEEVAEVVAALGLPLDNIESS
jgi:hypothetical protein